MTPDRPHDDDAAPDDNGVLPDASGLDTTFDTTAIGIIGGAQTAQVPVSVPGGSEDDLDDDVVDDGVPYPEFTQLVENPEAPDDEGRVAAAPDVMADEDEPLPIEATVDDEDAAADPHRGEGERAASDVDGAADVQTAEVVVTADPPAAAMDSGGPVPEDENVTDNDVDPAPAASTTRAGVESDEAAATPATVSTPAAGVPATRRAAHHTGGTDRVHDVERVHPTATEMALTSKRLGEFDHVSESPDLLTADRLLDPSRVARPEPEGRWQHFVYAVSRRRINLGDGRRARERKALDRRIAAPLPGDARFVPVLSRKGGVGKTTVTTLLGMALAAARDDRVIAIDANPDRGTLAERIAGHGGRTVRDLVRSRSEIDGYADVSAIVTRDRTRLDVLASDADPRVSEAFSDRDYHDVSSLAAHYYSIVLTDTGTGIVHSVMGATLELADQLVVVAGLSVDEARLASETLTWLETNGYAEQVRAAVVVLNNSRPGAPLVRPEELEAHFRTRVRTVVRVPYDPMIATGSVISFAELQPATREAARRLAAEVVEGLRAPAAAA